MDGFRRMRALGLAIGLIAALPAARAAAQAVDCNALALQIATLGRSAAPDRAQEATRRAQADLAGMIGRARALGCDKPNFLFFGSRPPQCDGLNAQIQRMQAVVAQMQRTAYGDPGLRQQLQNKYDTWCRDGLRREPSFLDKLFGGDERTYPPEEAPLEDQQQTASGGPVAVCVRTCDGGSFPVSYSARRGDLGPLQELCTALCPNTEAKVYTRSLSRDMHSAVSATGEPYADLPNAFRFEKVADKACTCKPPDKGWAEALLEAERLLGQRKGDLIVTPQKAEELSRPRQANAAPASAPRKDRKFDPAATQKLIDARKAADAQTEADRALAAQAPTASHESSGIDVGRSASPVARGELRDSVGPDGKTRPMRVLGQ
jgi:hypothetical protein